MTTQEVFDRVVAHARTQNEKCINDKGDCVYRGPRGLKCFIGALIPDDEYKPDFEGLTVNSPGVYIAAGIPADLSFVSLARDLQSVHDNSPVVFWEERFKEVAELYKLTYTAP